MWNMPLKRFFPYLLFGLFSALIFLSCGKDNIAGYDKTPDISNTSLTDKDNNSSDDSTESIGPQLTIKEPEFEFGFTPQNSKISHIFSLHSTGDDTLRILSVRPGWGCTYTPLDKDVLAPGKKANLEIIFSTKHYRGLQVKSPSITTNETYPDSRKNVRIYTYVVSNPDSTYPIVIKPYKLNISQFGTIIRDRMNFRIENVSDSHVNFRVVDYPGELINIIIPTWFRYYLCRKNYNVTCFKR